VEVYLLHRESKKLIIMKTKYFILIVLSLFITNSLFASLEKIKTVQGNDETENSGDGYNEGEGPNDYPTNWAPGTIPYYTWGAVGLDGSTYGWVKYVSNNDGLSPNTTALTIKIRLMSNAVQNSEGAEIFMGNCNTTNWDWEWVETVTDVSNHIVTIDIPANKISTYINSYGRCEVSVKSADGFVIDYVEFWQEPLPEISLTPSPHSFPNTVANTSSGCGECSSEKSFTLENVGGGTATGSVSLSNSTHYTITDGGGNFSLTSGSQETIKVKFCPQSTGTKTASLNANAADPCNDVSSSLSGSGIAPTGSKSIIVHNVGGDEWEDATCKLFNSSGTRLDTESTNGDGEATFDDDNIPLGSNYYIKVSNDGTPPYSGTEEWGRTGDFDFTCGSNDDEQFYRHLPYGSTAVFSYDAAGTQLINSSTDVPSGSTVYMNVLVESGYGSELSCKLSTLLDINQSSPYNVANSTQTHDISASGNYPFQRSFTVTDEGTYYYSLMVESNPFNSSSYVKTDTWNWNPAFNVIQVLGNKTIIVHNGDDLIQYATCILFNSSGTIVDTEPTNINGEATFTDIPLGSNYYIKVSVDGTPPYSGTEEWGRTGDFNISNGSNDDEQFYRHLPYGSTAVFSYDAAGTQLINSSTDVPSGSTVYMNVLVESGYGSELSCKLSTLLDINQSSPYNVANSTQTHDISASGNYPFQRSFTVTDDGTYYYSLMVESNPFNSSSYVKTDTWNWNPAFNVIPPPQIQTLSYNGSDYYINGANVPWNSCGNDVGTHYDWGPLYQPDWFESTFSDCEVHGINTLRLWLHFDGRTSPEFDANGYVTGLDDNFFDNLDDILLRANNHNIMLILCLWSFDMTKDFTSDAGIYAGLHADLITDVSKTNSYINNALMPMVERYSNTCNLLAWEVINEPEWSMDITGGGNTSQTVPAQDMQRFVGMIAEAVHENSTKMVTVGSASLKWNSDKYEPTTTPCVGNFWKDSEIQSAYNDPDAYLDFYSIHYFDWMSSPFSFDPFNLNYPYSYWLLDKPTIIEECQGNSNNYSSSDMISNATNNQFIGTMFWSVNGNDGKGTFDDFKNETKSFRDDNISIVDFDCSFSITLNKPNSNITVNQGDEVTIDWFAFGNSNSAVTIYYDEDQTWNNGNETVIINGQTNIGSHNWQTTNVPEGTYYIVSEVSDGSNGVYDYAPGMVTVAGYDITMELYRISEVGPNSNTSDPGTEKTSFIPGETVRVTFKTKNEGTEVPIQTVLNIQSPNNPDMYDSNPGENNTNSLPADGSWYYYSFDWVIPADYDDFGSCDIGGSIRNFTDFDILYETTCVGANTDFENCDWVLEDEFFIVDPESLNWSSYMANPQNTGGMDLDLPLNIINKFTPSETPIGSRNLAYIPAPSIYENKAIFISNMNGLLYCYNINNGSQIWVSNINSGTIHIDFSSQPAISNNIVVVGSASDRKALVALDVETGNELWSYELDGIVWSSPKIHNQNVYINNEGYLYCFDLLYGSLNWMVQTYEGLGYPWVTSYNTGGVAISEDGNRIIVPYGGINTVDGIYENEGGIACFNCNTHEAIWNITLNGSTSSTPVIYNDFVYYNDFDDLLKIDLLYEQSSNKNWIEPLIAGNPAIINDKIFINKLTDGYFDIELFALDLNGNVLWEYDRAWDQNYNNPTVSNNLVLIGTDDDYLVGLDQNTGDVEFEFNIVRPSNASINNNGEIVVLSGVPTSFTFAKEKLYVLEASGDNESPTCTLLTPNQGGAFNGNISITSEAVDNNSVFFVEFQYSIDNINWNILPVGIQDDPLNTAKDYNSTDGWGFIFNTVEEDAVVGFAGNLNAPQVWFRSRSSDNSGNVSLWDVCDNYICVDNLNPNEPIINELLAWYSENTSFNIDFTDNININTIKYQINSNDNTNPSNWHNLTTDGINEITTFSGTEFTDDWMISNADWGNLLLNAQTLGWHYVYFKVEDEAGNVLITSNQEEAFCFGKDVHPPTAFFTLPEEGQVIEIQDPYMHWSVADVYAGLELSGVENIFFKLDEEEEITLPPNTGFIQLDGLDEGPHTVYLYATDIAGNESVVNEVNFTIDTNIDPPNPFALTSPSDEITLTDLTPTFQWESTVDPDGGSITYELWYDYDPSFSNSTEESSSNNYFTPSSNLVDNSIIFWKVKAIDDESDIRWCNETDWYFILNTQNDPPLAFGLNDPEDEETIYDLSPYFDWTNSSDIDPGDDVTYYLWLSLQQNFSSPDEYSTTNSEYSLSDLNPNTTYYWKVKAVDNQGAITWSSETDWWFTTPPVNTYTISGTILDVDSNPVENVTVTFDGAGGGVATTNASGYYEITVTQDYTGTATPSKSNWSFAPTSRPYSNVSSDISNEDYVGSPDCYVHDFDCDGDVDIDDITMAANCYGTSVGDADYNSIYDMDSDGDIDIVDISIIAFDFGWTE